MRPWWKHAVEGKSVTVSDFWYKGHITLQQGDLMIAIELFSNGMEAIRPVLNQELFCSLRRKDN